MQTKTIELKTTRMHPSGNEIIHYVSLKTQWHTTESQNIALATLLSEEICPIGIEITHNNLTTQLDFTGVTPYEIWYFDAEKQFTGKTFSSHQGSGTFRVETQARFILIWNTKEDEKTKQKLQNFNCKKLLIDENTIFTKKNLSGDYGKFPYFIINHPKSPCFSQIPIHIVANEGVHKNLIGSVIKVSEEILKDEVQKLSLLLDVFKLSFDKVNADAIEPKKMCLVLAPNVAYYLTERNQEPSFSNSIPSGGVLLDMNAHRIAENTEHYI